MNEISSDVLGIVIAFALGLEPSATSVRAVASTCTRWRDVVARNEHWCAIVCSQVAEFDVKIAIDHSFDSKGRSHYEAKYRCGGRPFGPAEWCTCGMLVGCFCCLPYQDLCTPEASCGQKTCGCIATTSSLLLWPISGPVGALSCCIGACATWGGGYCHHDPSVQVKVGSGSNSELKELVRKVDNPCQACRQLLHLIYIEQFQARSYNLMPELTDWERDSLGIAPPPIIMVDGERQADEEEDSWDASGVPL